jgi:hypothetical protein
MSPVAGHPGLWSGGRLCTLSASTRAGGDESVGWLNRERLTMYPRIILAGYILCGAYLVWSAASSPTGLTDFLKRPLGADFSHYWLASSLAQAGHPLMVYQAPAFIAALEAYFKVAYPVPWFYPPTFLLLIYPLAFLPYLASLGLWLAATLAAFLTVVRRIAPHPLTLWLALAFPGTFQNFFNGQNGFLSTALLGGGLCLLDQSPWLAGALLGLISYKPHLFPLVPVALIAARRWRALLAALLTALLLAGASLLVFGPGVWLAFGTNLGLTMSLTRQGLLPINKLVTIFGALIQAGVGFPYALTIQAVATLAAAAGVFYLWRRPVAFAYQAAALVLATFLFTPYAFSYDLALLALPLAWLAWEGYNTGWRPGEPALLCLGWLLPILASVMAIIKFQFTPVILAALLIWVVKSAAVVSRPPGPDRAGPVA